MEQSEFDKRFSEIKSMFELGNSSYGFSNRDAVWENVDSTPLDKFFVKLAELYLESNDHQRLRLYSYCGQQNAILENLWYFIRRIGKLIRSKNDKKWFELGIVSALLDGGRADFRDLIISLVLLRFVSEKNGINTSLVFDTFIPSAQGELKSLLENVRNYSESSIHMTVQTFGPPEWVAESVKIYGEHKMYSSDKERLLKQSQITPSKIQWGKMFWKKIGDLLKGK